MNSRPLLPKFIVAGLAAAAVSGVLTEAHAADPTTADCLTASEKSIALRNQHNLRAARAELLVCAAANCPTDVRNECTRRVAEVNAAMPTIVFEAKMANGNDVSAVKVTMDGQTLVERLEGTALSIDPGEHTFLFETAGQDPIQKQFVINEGVKDRRERIVFGMSDGTAATSAGPLATGLTSPTEGSATGGQPVRDTGSSGETQRILGWTATGLGAIGLGLGVVFVAQQSSKQSDADAVCPSGVNCPVGSNARIQELNDDAKSAGTLAAVSFVTGGVLIAGGLALVFTAPKSQSGGVAAVPVVGPNFQGVMVTGQTW